MAKTRILFLATHPKEIASTRYRVLAYDPRMRQEGYETQFQPFFPSEALGALYASRQWPAKASWLLKGARKRWETLRAGCYDLVFIHRELFPLGIAAGMTLLGEELRRTKCPLVYDFDDAVFLPHRKNRGLAGKLENARSVRDLIAGSQQIIAGNSFLAEYAKRLNSHVSCIPTPVDTTRYFPPAGRKTNGMPTLGWIGSPSTAKYLQGLLPVFGRLARTHRFRLKIIGAGTRFSVPGVDLDQRPWDLATEAEEFRTCDIGVYPLWNDEWSLGKCGYKALQFMASGVPVVASAVGMNEEIISRGTNGLLASSEEEWAGRLIELLESPPLRKRLAEAGRDTIEERYSLAKLSPRFLTAIEETLSSGRRTEPARSGPVPVNAGPAAREDILCFSSIDWDFVWQGHQEIMITLARQGHRVLFIENTGVRGPRLREDISRIQHRFGKWRRSIHGFWQVQENLYVFSPLVLPFPYSRAARWLNRWFLGSALRHWMQMMDFHRPVCWTFLPTPLTLDIIRRVPHRALVYYCIDSFADSTPAAQRILKSERTLMEQADLVFVTSQKLFRTASESSRNVSLFPFGVSLDHFEEARNTEGPIPADLRALRRPIVGYVGGIHQWLDQELLCRTARAHPEYSFAMVGPVQTDAERLRREPNIHLLGQKPHEQVPHYIKQFDAGIIPYRLTDYTSSVYPTKLNEYLAMGKPVVSTALPEVRTFGERHPSLVEIAESAEQFQRVLEQALAEDSGPLRRRRIEAARDNAWAPRIASMQDLIQQTVLRKTSEENQDWARRLTHSIRGSYRSWRWALGALLLFLAVFYTPAVWWAARPLVVQSALKKSDAIVVFAGGVGESGQVGESYQQRVQQAVQLYREGFAPKLLFLSGFTWTFREVDLMSALAVSMGVPSEAIRKVTDLQTTRDYVLRVKETAEKEGWKSLLVITSPYHTRRAEMTFRKNAPGLEILPAPVTHSSYYAHDWGISVQQLRGILHELISILVYRMRGWL